jgi:hypothetical protein
MYKLLTRKGECYVEIGRSDVVLLSLKPTIKKPQQRRILSNDVPILLREREEINITNMSVNFVLQYINGENYVSKIAELASADEDTVKIALQQLLQA